MSEIVERVAAAISNSSLGIQLSKEQLDLAARAAILAMREPTAAMCSSEQATWSLGWPMWNWWRDMIDIALAPHHNC